MTHRRDKKVNKNSEKSENVKNPKRFNFLTFAKETPLKVHQDPFEDRTRQIVEELVVLLNRVKNVF